MNGYLEIHDFLSTKIKENILIEHVYPYLYKKQPNHLLRDIVSFGSIKNKIDDVYLYEFQPATLFNDLMYFMHNRVSYHGQETSCPNYMRIFHRFYKRHNMDDESIYSLFLKMNNLSNKESNVTRINRLILGMMLPEEREYFQNNYVHTNHHS